MNKEGIDVRILFTSSKTLAPQLREVTFDKYKISSIPTAREALTDTCELLLLEFHDLHARYNLQTKTHLMKFVFMRRMAEGRKEKTMKLLFTISSYI